MLGINYNFWGSSSPKKSVSEINTTNPDTVQIGNITKATPAIRWNPGKVIRKWGTDINPFTPYDVVFNKGVNGKNARPVDVCLAKYSQKVAKDISTLGQCYTGVKRALLDAGIINKYEDMPRGSARDATDYFDKNPKKFKKLDIEGDKLKSLPAGRIIVYKKDGRHGHIAITNGYGQETSDCTDNMKWLEAKGKGASFSAYELTDGWKYNSETKKLEFNEK